MIWEPPLTVVPVPGIAATSTLPKVSLLTRTWLPSLVPLIFRSPFLVSSTDTSPAAIADIGRQSVNTEIQIAAFAFIVLSLHGAHTEAA